MATEKTPLTKDDLAKAGKQLVEVGSQVKNKALDLANSAGNQYMPLRVVAILGGFGVFSTSALNFVFAVFTLHLTSSIVEFYCTLLGGVIVLMEVSKMVQVQVAESFHIFINKYIRILSFISGRGIFYFIVGTFKLSQLNILNLISGIFMCFVGVVYYIIGMNIARKLKKLGSGLLAGVNLRIKFSNADTNGTGFLNVGEFHILLKSLGVDLDKRETDLAFSQLDTNTDNVVTFEEFEKFCEEFQFETEYNDPDTAV